jgi:hypothetical protein
VQHLNAPAPEGALQRGLHGEVVFDQEQLHRASIIGRMARPAGA